MNFFGVFLVALFIIYNGKILKAFLNKVLGVKRNNNLSKINDDYINAMMAYMGEKDRQKKLKKAEEALLIQAKIAPLAYKVLIIGCYYWAVFIAFNALLGGSEILPGLNWTWTMITFAILLFLLKRTKKFEFSELLGA